MALDLLDVFEDASAGQQGRPVPPALAEMAVMEYLLVLKPTSTIWDEMVQIKQQVAQWCHCPEAAQSKPYITLLRFAQVAPAQETILRRLALATQGMLPLRITLRNYSGIPKHTLQVQVEVDALLASFLQQLKGLKPVLTLHKKQRPEVVKQPAICIARQLQPGAYEEGLAKLEPLEYSNVFVARECLLMARHRGGRGYKLLHSFAFQGLPAAAPAQQTKLLF